MLTNKNVPYYLAAIVLFFLLKFGYTIADNDHLVFLLKPIDKFFGLLTGSHSIYLPHEGYYHESLNILINKSCSGFNFWILSFLAFTYLGIKYSNNQKHRILSLPAALLSGYLLTIFANTSRIFASIIIQNQTKFFLPDQQHLVHEAVGIITNLSFLILTYYFTEIFLIHRRQNEKSA